MRIGIIGPGDVDKFCISSGIDKGKYLADVENIAEKTAKSGNEIIVVPQRNSVSLYFAEKYKKIDGKKIIGVIPMDDTEFGIEMLDDSVVDEIINCVTWRNQAAKLAEECDIFLSLGFGAGTLIEIMSTKYWKAKVYVIEDFITSKLPKESERDIELIYLKLEEAEKAL